MIEHCTIINYEDSCNEKRVTSLTQKVNTVRFRVRVTSSSHLVSLSIDRRLQLRVLRLCKLQLCDWVYKKIKKR